MAKREEKAPEKKNEIPPWKERHKILATYKAEGLSSWTHLYVAENKLSGKRLLRLKKHLNWWAIPDSKHFSEALKLLRSGGKDMGWADDETKFAAKDTKPTTAEKAHKEIGTAEIEGVDDEVVDLLKRYPDLVKKIIATDLSSKGDSYVLDVADALQGSLVITNERFRVAVKELLGKLSKEKDAQGVQELSDLMERWNLHQISSIANTVKSRLETIGTLEDAIHNEETYEIKGDNSIHRILEKNMWIVDENLWIVQSNKSLRTFIVDGLPSMDKQYESLRPDFVCVKHGQKTIILEIKRPSIALGKKEMDQAELYYRLIKKHSAKAPNLEIYLVGNTISDEARDLAEIRSKIKLMTYQELLEDCRVRYTEYLKIAENSEI